MDTRSSAEFASRLGRASIRLDAALAPAVLISGEHGTEKHH